MQFSQILKKLMDERGLTNYQLAKELDIHPTTVANWLDNREPRKKTLLLLSNYFGVSVEYLLGVQKEKPATFSDDELKEINSIFNELSPDNRSKLLELAHLYITSQHSNEDK